MTESETKHCVSCHAQFTIEPEDRAFYQKIDVPPPTWCPQCRFVRRQLWRNERFVFWRDDAQTGKKIFSGFSANAQVKVYDNPAWNSDSWDGLTYGRDYDFSRPFFTQLNELLRVTPLPARAVYTLENSDYSNNANGIRNCYLVRGAVGTEDSAYLVWDHASRNCFDDHMTESCELCYGSTNLTNCYQTYFSVNCEGCRGVVLSRDCIGCQDCFGCTNLRNKQYYIWNEPHTKEAYEEKLKQFDLGSFAKFEHLRTEAEAFWIQYPNKFMEGSSNEHVSGEYLYESKNLQSGFRARGVEASKYCQNIIAGPAHSCYDYTNWGQGAELVYESNQCGDRVYNVQFSAACFPNIRNVRYSIYCEHCSDLFGCVGLRKKQYCILNKQYTKERYEMLLPKIRQQMDAVPYTDKAGRVYRYGEFFPPELSPYEYNITFAQEELPLTKQDALAQGLGWYEQPRQERTAELQAVELPDTVTGTSADLAGKVIECLHSQTCNEQCSGAFTIIPQELAFLIQQGLPLPRLCPNCRHYERIKYRRSFKLVKRQCQCAGVQSSNGAYRNLATNHTPHATDSPCPNQFETSYAPDQPDIVYCESCYQSEVI